MHKTELEHPPPQQDDFGQISSWTNNRFSKKPKS